MNDLTEGIVYEEFEDPVKPTPAPLNIRNGSDEVKTTIKTGKPPHISQL